jgi:hypothetical protein
MFEAKVTEKIKIHIFCSITFFTNRAVYKIKWKNAVEPQATDDNMAHVHCMVDTKRSLKISSAYCFSTATPVV